MEHKADQGALSTCRRLGSTTESGSRMPGWDPGVYRFKKLSREFCCRWSGTHSRVGRLRVEVKINREALVYCRLFSSS